MKLSSKIIVSLSTLISALIISVSGAVPTCIIGGGYLCTAGAAPGSPVTIFITSGTSWSVPADWNNSNNTIEVIGGGGGGGPAMVTNNANTGGSAGLYGGGGGGGGGSAVGGVRGPGGAGAQGIIVITYTP